MKKIAPAAVMLSAASGAAALAWAAPIQNEPPPIAVYWVSASTTSGFMAQMMGAGGGRPSMGAIMGMMAHGGPDPNAAQHSLKLQLGSLHRAADPAAEHDAPNGLGAGPVLPLVTPRPPPASAPPQEEEERPKTPERFQRPQGRMLIFWGCGEHAGPGQPLVIDFAHITDAPARFAGLMRGLSATPMRPPSPGRYATYGEWPNERSSATIPPTGSLVGPHVVRGNYSPEIRFSLGPNQDFMSPLRLTTNAPTPSGSVQLAWQPIPTATGYFISVMGGAGGRGGDGGGDQGQGSTLVMWTSSAAQTAAFAAPDYIAPGDARRLVAERAVLSPDTTSCVVPQEVSQAAPHGILSMTAWGDEANFGYPARPAPPIWAVKVRYRSSTSAILGQPGPRGAPNQGNHSLLHGLGGLIP